MTKSRRDTQTAGVASCLPLLFFIATSIVVAGCAAAPSREAFRKDGKQYGTTRGPFHSRWWNYYERGCSFADGAFWSQAEHDLRTAMSLRPKDQLWPRTYGLHFLPEYFPHRELGVVLFHQRNFDEAIAELQASLAFRHSARAAYFLAQARKQSLAVAKKDYAPPTVTIEPIGSVSQAKVTVKGTARADAFVARIAVNGVPYPVSVSETSVTFEQETSLVPGDNVVTVDVEDLRGSVSRTEQIAVVDLDGPAVSFDEPATAPGTARGIVNDKSGVKQLHIDGKAVPLSIESSENCSFAFGLDAVDVKKPVQYEAVDALNNVTRGIVPFKSVVVTSRESALAFASSLAPPALVPVASGLWALYDGDRLLAATRIAQSVAKNGFTANFSNITDGRKYLLEEIAVGISIDGEKPVAKAALNGTPLPIVVGRPSQRITRRVALQPGANRLLLEAEDENGAKASAELHVERQLTEVEQAAAKLNVAVLGNVWKGNSPKLENESAFIADEFQRELGRRNRFGLVNRELLPNVLQEQELNAALGSKEDRLALGKVVPAEVLIIGRVRRDADSMELIAEAISSETSQFIGRADVAGPAENVDQLRRLVSDLALRFVQEFPRAQGQVALVRGSTELVTNLGATLNVREAMKLTVFRYGEEILDPVTKESLGKDSTILGDAIVEKVDEKKSTAQRVASPEHADVSLQVGDFVIVK